MPDANKTPSKPASKRIEALDYLRGWFIIIIVIDHLTRWPSALEVITGRGELWVNASDGFLITSGLLIGYIRGFKDRDKPLKAVAAKLLKRSLSLYFWGVLSTVILFSLAWVLPVGQTIPVYLNPGGWLSMVFESITLQYIHPYTYFLHLYALYMILSIGVVWLLRKKLWWIIVLLVGLSFIYTNQINSPLIERMPAFFLPTIIGFYLDPIRAYVVSRQQSIRRLVSGSIVAVFLVSLVMAVIYRFFAFIYTPATYETLSVIFSRDPITIYTATLGFIWYLGLFIIFNHFLKFLKKYLARVILPFSSGSFSAYTVHGLALIAISLLPLPEDNLAINTVLGLVAVVLTIVIIRLPIIKRVVPQ